MTTSDRIARTARPHLSRVASPRTMARSMSIVEIQSRAIDDATPLLASPLVFSRASRDGSTIDAFTDPRAPIADRRRLARVHRPRARAPRSNESTTHQKKRRVMTQNSPPHTPVPTRLVTSTRATVVDTRARAPLDAPIRDARPSARARRRPRRRVPRRARLGTTTDGATEGATTRRRLGERGGDGEAHARAVRGVRQERV
tara:strand:+ start:13098 stop:13700 length:603 start_codon:yes stop_codon:yes gene_type:complete